MTYPTVYVFPMIGLSSAKTVAVLAIQVGHCESDLGLDACVSAQWVAVVTEVTYPVMYVFPLIGLSIAKAVVPRWRQGRWQQRQTPRSGGG